MARRPAGRLLLGTLQTLVGAGAVRAAPAAPDGRSIADDARDPVTLGEVTREDFVKGAARATRVDAVPPGLVVLDYERGVLREVDEYLELLADAPHDRAVELDYRLTWAVMRPSRASDCSPLVRLDLRISGLPTRTRVVIEAKHHRTLWNLASGMHLVLAFAGGDPGKVGLDLGPVPDPRTLAQLLQTLEVPFPSRAPRTSPRASRRHG